MTTVLFVCVHNAGRSQMAEALTNHLAAERGLPVRAESAGTMVGERVNPVVAQAMAEIGISLDAHRPKQITQEMVGRSARIITMGCEVDAAACPARFLSTDDWGLDDPTGQPIESVRAIREQIRRKVGILMEELAATSPTAAKGSGR